MTDPWNPPPLRTQRWSAVRALHARLSGQPWAPGYTKELAALAPPASTFLSLWRSGGAASCVDPAVMEQRSKVIHNYLSALLAEPLVRACVRARVRAWVRGWVGCLGGACATIRSIISDPPLPISRTYTSTPTPAAGAPRRADALGRGPSELPRAVAGGRLALRRLQRQQQQQQQQHRQLRRPLVAMPFEQRGRCCRCRRPCLHHRGSGGAGDGCRGGQRPTACLAVRRSGGCRLTGVCMQWQQRDTQTTHPITHKPALNQQQPVLRRVPRCHHLVSLEDWPPSRPDAAMLPPAHSDDDGDSPRLRAFQFLLETHSLAPLLGTQDLRWLSLCRRDFRPFERQITSLRPRAAHEPASPLLARLQQRVGRLRDGLVRGLWGEAWLAGEALSAGELGWHAAKREREEAGWDAFWGALEAGRVPQLERLDFSVSELERRPRLPTAPALRLARGLQFLPHLLVLDLEGSAFGSAGAVALADGLRHTPRLQCLMLQDTYIGDEGMVALAPVLPLLPALRTLGLSRCRIETLGAVALAAQFSSLPALRQLYIGDIGGYEKTLESTYDTVLRSLRHLRSLRWLIVCSNWLYDDGAIVLASVLPSLPKLRGLNVSAAKIGDVGIRAIAAALPFLPRLQRLTVDGNEFGHESYRMMCRAATRQGLVIEWDLGAEKRSCEPSALLRADKRSFHIRTTPGLFSYPAAPWRST